MNNLKSQTLGQLEALLADMTENARQRNEFLRSRRKAGYPWSHLREFYPTSMNNMRAGARKRHAVKAAIAEKLAVIEATRKLADAAKNEAQEKNEKDEKAVGRKEGVGGGLKVGPYTRVERKEGGNEASEKLEWTLSVLSKNVEIALKKSLTQRPSGAHEIRIILYMDIENGAVTTIQEVQAETWEMDETKSCMVGSPRSIKL